MTPPRLLQTGTFVAALLLAVAGCSGHKSTASSAPSTSAVTRHSAAPAAATPAKTSTPSTPSAGASGTKTCPAGDTSGLIGGKSKCLAVGQLCSAKNVGDYPQFGFTCTQQGTRYVLAKKQ